MSDLHDGSKHLLIVDDDLDGAYALGEALAEWFDFSITYASCGPEAVSLVMAHPQRFDVALIDQHLEDPRMDGIDTMREIFKLNPLLPVLLFTGQEFHTESLRAIDEGAYLYLPLQKGAVSASQLGYHCQAAMHDRTKRWQALFQAMSHALHSLNVERVFETCEQGLRQLGYNSGAIYRSVPGWVVLDIPLAEGLRKIERRTYLRCERAFEGTVSSKTIDLTEQSDIRSAIEADQSVAVFRDADGAERVLLPLKSEQQVDSSGNLLGLLILYHQPTHSLEPREEANLSSLGQQVSLALQNALAYRQLEYRRATASQILATNHRILALEYSAGAAEAILGEFAQVIAQALGFQRVLISTVNDTKGMIEHSGIAGFAPDYRLPDQDLATFVALNRPEYQRGACFFIPEGCYSLDQNTTIRLHDEGATVCAPYEWHAGDKIRAQIVSARGKVLGYITVDQRRSNRRPDTNVFEALELFATQIAVAIENLNYQQMIEAIQQVSVKISRTRNRDVLFQTVYQQLKTLMYADVMMIGRYVRERDDDHQIEVLYRRRIVPQERDRPRFYSPRRGLSGYIVRTGKPLLFTNQAQIREFHQRHDIEPIGAFAQSWMGVPLQVDNRVIGVIALKDREREGIYSERDQRLLAILADQIAIALRRIELENERRDADLRAMTQLSLTTAVGEVPHPPGKPQRAERLILEWACRYTGADYGVLLRYDEDDHSLVPSEGYVAHPDRDILAPNIDPALRLPRDPQPGTRASLSVVAARAKRCMHWGNVLLERNYYRAITSTRSQLSIPLLSPDPAQSLLGVLTLESRKPKSFDRLRRSTQRAIGNVATMFFQRAREHQQIRSTLGRYMFDLGNEIIHHSYVTEVRGLSTNLETAIREFVALLDDLQVLYDHARRIPLSEDIHLERRKHVRLNDIVRAFLESNHAFYRHPTIELRTACYLADSEVVYANPLGVGEALKILVDNAFQVLIEQPYGGHEIVISTDGNATGNILCVSNTGPPLSEKNIALVEDDIAEWDASSHGIVKLKALLRVYGATLKIGQNNSQGVIFAISFPRNSVEIAPIDEQLRQQIGLLQRGIASHSALLYARVVSERAPQLQQLSGHLRKKLEDIRMQPDLLTADFGVKLYDRDPIVLSALLSDFVEAFNRRQNGQDCIVPIEYHMQPEDDVKVYVSRLALREVLRNLANNARQAVLNTRLSDGKIAHKITVQAECVRSRVRIHICNTGSFIPDDIANRLFEYEIKSRGLGRGLLLSNSLLVAFGGSIRLTMNDREQGVQFTIELPRIPATAVQSVLQTE